MLRLPGERKRGLILWAWMSKGQAKSITEGTAFRQIKQETGRFIQIQRFIFGKHENVLPKGMVRCMIGL